MKIANNPAKLTIGLKEKASSLGFNMVGIMDARPARRLAAYHRWLENGYYGEMNWMARPDRRARRDDPSVILPGVHSIISVGLDYGSNPIPDSIANHPGRGRISNYAWGKDYHQVMTPRLQLLAEWLVERAAAEVESRAYIDTGAILERDHGETAGLGFTGKNSMLINSKQGSWFFLGELLTTANLLPDHQTISQPSCGTCSRCMAACPTGAFPQPYVLDARRCISYLTIELKGWIPIQLRPLMGNWVYGCDICQEVCPFNRFASESAEDGFSANDWESAAPYLVDLLALDEDAFRVRFNGTPIQRVGRGRLVRNCCVAAGNWGSPDIVPSLLPLLGDSETIVRGHSAWALGRIGTEFSGDVLRKALANEDEPAVRSEIERALVK